MVQRIETLAKRGTHVKQALQCMARPRAASRPHITAEEDLPSLSTASQQLTVDHIHDIQLCDESTVKT